MSPRTEDVASVVFRVTIDNVPAIGNLNKILNTMSEAAKLFKDLENLGAEVDVTKNISILDCEIDEEECPPCPPLEKEETIYKLVINGIHALPVSSNEIEFKTIKNHLAVTIHGVDTNNKTETYFVERFLPSELIVVGPVPNGY